MCDPTVLAAGSLLLKAGSGVANYASQNKAAAQNKANATAAFQQNLEALNERGTEEQIAAQAQINQAGRATAENAAKARLSAAAGGVSGSSVDALLQVVKGQGAAYGDSVRANLGREQSQLDRARMGELSTLQSRINSVPGGNALQLGLQLAGAGLDFANTTSQRTPPSYSVGGPSTAPGIPAWMQLPSFDVGG